MCGCSTHQSQTSKAVDHDPSALALKVEDMACGHCASAITKAIEVGLPGVKVEADLASKSVLVRGAADLSKVKALVTEAGYTPSVA
ncbi:heavy-metal-associated domain-containing protein [Microvirga terrestris]|uniref:Heavy-metal-associated domain-containing protein n=1 Tax=Microvirga terrestris TaxID=2791024 RepID=A0ABS0HV50_9HYPH|nr:heavy-metal-associated domain-containing protein [Microvirga terrestris]MBF9197376.1 heavy-metal-associated domain-containing protein [Microvirga terrestris]